jgi:hemoglobin-like flavoprotein
MALDVDALRTSFEVVVERSPDITHRFYDVLFERYPQVRGMFGRNSRPAQEKMLTQALAAVIDHLEDGPWLAQTLGGMGKKHEGYGVTREMYYWVGDALLTTLAECLGDDWTPRVSRAWSDAYAAIAGMMLAGTEDVCPAVAANA